MILDRSGGAKPKPMNATGAVYKKGEYSRQLKI